MVSVLEGGYRTQGQVVSAFSRSVAAHVRALAEPNHQVPHLRYPCLCISNHPRPTSAPELHVACALRRWRGPPSAASSLHGMSADGVCLAGKHNTKQ